MAVYVISQNTTWFPNETTTLEIQNEYSQSGGPITASRIAAILVPIFFGMIFCVGVLGNCLVITVMLKIYRPQPQGLNNTNRFILNLAISDLLFLFFCVPFHASVYSMEEWPFGAFMCRFTQFCQIVSMLASIFTLTALSFDRYFAVVYATSAKQIRTKRNAILGIICIWVLAIGIGIPSLLTRIQIEFQGRLLCVPNYHMRDWYKWYLLVLSVLGYVLPLLVILSCYIGVMHTLLKNSRSSMVRRSSQAQGSHKRVTVIVILVVIVFAIDWCLHHVMSLWNGFEVVYYDFTETRFVLTLLAHCLSYANSCLNPLVYAFVSHRFRIDFKKAFTCQDISNAMVNVKVYSRNLVTSFRNNINESRSGQQTSNGRKSEKFHPRPPIISPNSYNPMVRLNRLSTQDTANTCMETLSPVTNNTLLLDSIYDGTRRGSKSSTCSLMIQVHSNHSNEYN